MFRLEPLGHAVTLVPAGHSVFDTVAVFAMASAYHPSALVQLTAAVTEHACAWRGGR